MCSPLCNRSKALLVITPFTKGCICFPKRMDSFLVREGPFSNIHTKQRDVASHCFRSCNFPYSVHNTVFQHQNIKLLYFLRDESIFGIFLVHSFDVKVWFKPIFDHFLSSSYFAPFSDRLSYFYQIFGTVLS